MGKPVVDVAAALIVREGRVLLARRRPGDELGGLWEFPGGGREEGEDLRRCLSRELREELGIEVEVREQVGAVAHDYGAFIVHLHLFRAEITSGNPEPIGCAEVRWVPLEELDDLPLAPADKALLPLIPREGRWRRRR